MPDTLIVSNRGRITLPAAIRRHLGIKGGDAMLIECRNGEIVLKPGVAHERHYSNEQIAQWDADDKLEPRERKRMLEDASPPK